MAKQLEFDFRHDIDPPDVSYRLLEEEQPQYRLEHLGEGALSLRELLAVVIGSGHSDDSILELTRLLGELGGLPGIVNASISELTTWGFLHIAQQGSIQIKPIDILRAIPLGSVQIVLFENQTKPRV